MLTCVDFSCTAVIWMSHTVLKEHSRHYVNDNAKHKIVLDAILILFLRHVLVLTFLRG